MLAGFCIFVGCRSNLRCPSVQAFNGGFTGCADITVDFLYLKGQIGVKPPAIPLGPVELQVDVIVKVCSGN